jgi:DNA-binding HxlR family transcriptional regulator
VGAAHRARSIRRRAPFRRFPEAPGAAKNILATRLRGLVCEGILELRPASDGSAYQEYVLTKKGRSLYTVMIALHQWGQENLFEPGEPTTALLDRATRRPLRKLEILSADGVPLGLADLTLVQPDATGELKPA